MSSLYRSSDTKMIDIRTFKEFDTKKAGDPSPERRDAAYQKQFEAHREWVEEFRKGGQARRRLEGLDRI